jgi:extradiol dioxygenase family protein
MSVPFHHAFPVHNLNEARAFYGGILGCEEGRSSDTWIDFSFGGNQIVCHYVGDNYRCIDYFNNVDTDAVPVPHFGIVVSVEEFHTLSERVKKAGISFIVEPHVRFQGEPGEQWTMFFKDPSSNNIECKAMVHPENLFRPMYISNGQSGR